MKLNIHTFGDIINLKDNTNQWFDEITLTKLGLKCLYQWTLIKKAPVGLTLLRQQSCWIRLEHNDIIEYLGQIAIKGTKKLGLMFRKWVTTKEESINMANKVQLSSETPSMLAGTGLVLNYREVWPQFKIESNNEEHTTSIPSSTTNCRYS
jgi:hypothetical protein